MTVKQFFKSTAFKSIIVLLCVLLVSGVFLTIMNGLLEVTDEEKRNRAISKIYGAQVEVSADLTETANYKNDSAEIQEAYQVIDDGNYLIKSKGLGGYSGGNVTCWVVVNVSNNSVTGVGKVVIDSNSGQTLMSQFNDSVLNQFSQKYNANEPYSSDIITGATAVLTKNAICNAVNGAIGFVKETQLGAVWVSPYTDFDFIQYININENQTTHEVKSDESVEYHIVTKGYGDASSFKIDITVKDGAITDYTITKNGSTDGEEGNYKDHMPNVEGILIGKDLSYFTEKYGENMAYKPVASFDDNDITTGATTEEIGSNSTYLCMYAGAFATANYQKCIDASKEPVDPFEDFDFLKYINTDKTSYEFKDDGSVEYLIVTKGYSAADPFTIQITVKDDIITEYEITKNGSTYGYDENMPPVADIVKGNGLNYFTGLYGEDMGYKAISSFDDSNLTTGATNESIASNSTYLCMYAGAFATANYQKIVSANSTEGGESNE